MASVSADSDLTNTSESGDSVIRWRGSKHNLSRDREAHQACDWRAVNSPVQQAVKALERAQRLLSTQPASAVGTLLTSLTVIRPDDSRRRPRRSMRGTGVQAAPRQAAADVPPHSIQRVLRCVVVQHPLNDMQNAARQMRLTRHARHADTEAGRPSLDRSGLPNPTAEPFTAPRDHSTVEFGRFRAAQASRDPPPPQRPSQQYFCISRRTPRRN